jgi:hypothetical protein
MVNQWLTLRFRVRNHADPLTFPLPSPVGAEIAGHPAKIKEENVMRFSFATLVAATAVSAALLAGPALADEVNYHADLNAASETPPTDSLGTGTLDATYDTTSKLLTWTVTYSGLTGDVVAAHFHGPAAVGATAPPVVPLTAPYASPIKGTATLTDQQASDLGSGMWYINLHTAKYGDGEIRGQVTQADASSTSATPRASSSAAQ